MPDLGTIVMGSVSAPAGPTGPTGPAATLAGSSGDVQYNNNGALGAIAGITTSIVIPGVGTITVTKGVITAVT